MNIAKFLKTTFFRTPLVAASGSICSESYNKFLDSHFCNLHKCLFRIFLESHFLIYTSVFVLASCANCLVGSFPFKCRSWLWSLIGSNGIQGRWYLIIWLESFICLSLTSYVHQLLNFLYSSLTGITEKVNDCRLPCFIRPRMASLMS